jgi:predicted RecB family nuclease
MDMEVWSPAIPQITGTKPFEQIPFLVCFYNGKEFTHHFSGKKEDERKDFAMALSVLSEDYASILVYDKTMEVSVIDTLIKHHPEFKADLEKLRGKLIDIFDIFLGLDYYHPLFKNNFSLKTVSAVLLNEVSYSKIATGLEAMNYYEQFRSSEDGIIRQTLEQELVDYCNTDSLATYKLMKFLQGLK